MSNNKKQPRTEVKSPESPSSSSTTIRLTDRQTDILASLPPVLAEFQRLVLDRPVDVGLGVTGGLAVQNGRVALVHRRVLRLRLEANVHCGRSRTQTERQTVTFPKQKSDLKDTMQQVDSVAGA